MQTPLPVQPAPPAGPERPPRPHLARLRPPHEPSPIPMRTSPALPPSSIPTAARSLRHRPATRVALLLGNPSPAPPPTSSAATSPARVWLTRAATASSPPGAASLRGPASSRNRHERHALVALPADSLAPSSHLPKLNRSQLTAPPFVGFSRLASALTRSILSMAGGSLALSQAGATPNRLKRKAPDSSDAATTPTSAGEDEAAAGEEEDIEELEREVADLGRRILEHRRDAATRFLGAAVSRPAAFRPTASPEASSEQQSVSGTSLAEADQDMLEKLKIFKSRAEASIAARPKVLNQMNGCVARLEKLEQLNVYQRKR